MARKKILPIGVDLGSSAAKLVQLCHVRDHTELLACSTISIPKHLRTDQLGRLDYLAKHLPQTIKKQKFKGKKCVLALPASDTFVRHIRVNKRDMKEINTAVIKAVRVELPYPVDEAVLRHIPAGDVYEGGEVRQEVIVVAMPLSTLKAYLNLFTRIGLDVLSVSVEQVALVHCFSVLMGSDEEEATTLFLDMGNAGTQVTIAQGDHIKFSRNLHGGADHLNRAIGQAVNISPDEVQLMRQDLQYGKDIGSTGAEIQRWIDLWLDGIYGDIENCIRYYEAAFRKHDLERVVFTGGQSQDRKLCENLAQRLNLPAQIGDVAAMLGADKKNVSGSIAADEDFQNCLAVGAGLSLSAL
ncbi:MAG: pilus assembly protein PilM [Phycisphaerae bacterium]|nr:pilus assembly protein PilM [Phycisphaerae bacterium]